MIRHTFETGMYMRSRTVPRPRGAVVYIHGLGESGLSLERLIADPRLDRWNHFAPDIPGYGKSPWPESPLGLAGQAEYLAGWLEGGGDEPVVVFGHSMGGVVGLHLCERHPERVRAFLNVEGNISADDCTISKQTVEYSRDDFVSEGSARLLESFYRAGAGDPVLRDYFTSVRICDPRTYHLNSEELLAISGEGRIAERLAALECPCLYLLGDPRGTGGRSRSMLTDAGVEWRAIPDAGHWPFADQPDLFVGDMVSFLESVT